MQNALKISSCAKQLHIVDRFKRCNLFCTVTSCNRSGDALSSTYSIAGLSIPPKVSSLKIAHWQDKHNAVYHLSYYLLCISTNRACT